MFCGKSVVSSLFFFSVLIGFGAGTGDSGLSNLGIPAASSWKLKSSVISLSTFSRGPSNASPSSATNVTSSNGLHFGTTYVGASALAESYTIFPVILKGHTGVTEVSVKSRFISSETKKA